MIMARLTAAVLFSTMLYGSEGGAQVRDKSEARQLFNEGNRLYKQHKYEEALEKYRAAYKQQANPKVLPNMAAALEKLDQPLLAAATYQQYLQHPDAEADKKQRAQARLNKLDRKLVRIVVQPAQASMHVDGDMVERVPEGGLRVAPGTHEVVAEYKGYGRVSLTKEFSAGERYVVDLPPIAFEPKPDERQPVAGSEASEESRRPLPPLRSEEREQRGAEEPAPTPPTPAAPPPQPEVKAPAPKPESPVIETKPPQPEVKAPAPKPESLVAQPTPAAPAQKSVKGVRNAAIAVGAIAIASLATGSVLLYTAQSDFEEHGNFNRVRTRYYGGLAASSLGAAAAIADIPLAIIAARRQKKERQRRNTAWLIVPSGAGVMAAGTF